MPSHNFNTKMQLNKQQVKQLYPGIKIRKKFTVIDQQETYIFSLDVQDLKIIEFQCDFTGSENITIKNRSAHDRIVSKTVQPRELTQVAQVELHEGWKLQTAFRFRRRPIPKEKQLQYITPEVSAIQSEKTMVETVLRRVDIALTPVEELAKMLQKSKIKFIDSEFPPEEASIVGLADKNLIDDTVNHWRRPSDIYENFTLIDRMNHNHLVKGKLADNSFYSVVVCLTLANQSLLERLFFNQNAISPQGIYRLRLCKNGEWQSVTIDDLLPCQPLAKPKFASSSANQIWINLLQKAYAKLHKQYLNLHQLQVSNVFNDLTGCPTYIEQLSNPDFTRNVVQHLKYKHIVAFYDVEEKEFDEDEFIPLKNYAYPLLAIEEDEGKPYYKVLSHTHEKIELSEQELMKKFRYACVCYAKNWEEVRIKGKFMTAEAGGQGEASYPISMSRWYYSMDLPQASQVHICLHQEDVLIGNNQLFKPYAYCSLLLLQRSQKSILKPLLCKKYSHNRQIQLRMSLPAGIYLIIPFINSQAHIKKAPSQEDQIVDIFRKLDLLMRRELKFAELVPFFKVCGQVFDEEIFNELTKSFARGKKGIGLQAFREMWAKNRIYWKDCLDYYQRERLFTLSVHSTIEINVLIKSNIGTQYNNRAHCQLINRLGQDLPLQNKQYEKFARVKFYKGKSHIVEYMVQNRHDRKIEVEFDCNESSGYYFVPKSGKATLVLDSGQKQFIMKLIPFEKSELKELERQERVKVKTFD